MDVDLDEGRVTNAAEAMDLPGLDDENVAGAGLELFSIDGPETATFPYELDLVVRVTMRPRATPGEGAEKEDGDIRSMLGC